MPDQLTRRAAIRAATVSTLPLFWKKRAHGQEPAGQRPANDRLQLGVVGLGSRGFNLVNAFLAEADARIVALCDAHTLHYRDRNWGTGSPFGLEPGRALVDGFYAARGERSAVHVFRDFRELCALKSLDAVVVATPDHWHALCTLEALRQGKDVYCEKPVTHLFHEGQLVGREVARRQAVFQTGSQQRSDPLFVRAVELVRNGVIGRVQRVEVGLPPGYDRPQGEAVVRQPPEGLDYDMWCGPAPRLPYMRARHHRWWRGHRAFGGGVLMDWIGHHNDIAHWALGVERTGPQRVTAVDWKYPETDVYDTPADYTIRCEYAGGIISTISSRHPIGARLIGEDGWIHVRRGKLETSDPRWADSDFNVGSKNVYHSPGHARNFLDCMRSRKPCVAPAEVAHRSITPGHLGYVSRALGRPLEWDAVNETVRGDDEANRLLQSVDYRAPWKLATAST